MQVVWVIVILFCNGYFFFIQLEVIISAEQFFNFYSRNNTFIKARLEGRRFKSSDQTT